MSALETDQRPIPDSSLTSLDGQLEGLAGKFPPQLGIEAGLFRGSQIEKIGDERSRLIALLRRGLRDISVKVADRFQQFSQEHKYTSTTEAAVAFQPDPEDRFPYTYDSAECFNESELDLITLNNLLHELGVKEDIHVLIETQRQSRGGMRGQRYDDLSSSSQINLNLTDDIGLGFNILFKYGEQRQVELSSIYGWLYLTNARAVRNICCSMKTLS